MSKPIEDYGFISNLRSCALVARDGSMDWLCLPRFDSDACFAAILGDESNGRWLIRPAGEVRETSRRYRPGTAIIETVFATDEGAVTLIDFMPLIEDGDQIEVVRIVRGDLGHVRMRMEFIIRPGFGHAVPWVRRTDSGLSAISGPDAFELDTPVELKNKDFKTVAEFSVGEGASVPFALCWHLSHKSLRVKTDTGARLKATESAWREWSSRCRFDDDGDNRWREAATRSLITLKGLTFQPTGGIVAAATTSLPEHIGGTRNWDYRFCWIRDATMTLYALLVSGYREEADAWRTWLLRAAAGHPAQLQIMYGIAGERRLTEIELPWLKGYASSRPVRIGNAAYSQVQLDVFGELLDSLHAGRKFELEPSQASWGFQKTLLGDLEKQWNHADHGIWEMRGDPRHFTHSRLMSWVAFDRAVRGVEDFGLEGPVDRWKTIRESIRSEILANAWSEKRQSFVQHYGGEALDSSLLHIPLVGFLPPDDPRVVATVDAVQRDLMEGGLLLRYRPEQTSSAVQESEGSFLVCSFWLADALTMIGRLDEATDMFERLLSLRNDLGLLAEQYDTGAKRQLGNFPQAFSHIGITNTAHNLNSARGPAEQRSDREKPHEAGGNGEKTRAPRKR